MMENWRGWRLTEWVNGGGDAAENWWGRRVEGGAVGKAIWGFSFGVLGVRMEEGKGD
jgi:hypothetical protein